MKLLNENECMDDTRESEQNVSIAEAARRLGKSQQFIRVSLQQGLAPFGFAVKRRNTFSYHISPKLLDEYIGEQEKGAQKDE